MSATWLLAYGGDALSSGWRDVGAIRLDGSGGRAPGDDAVAEEVPIALAYNGVPHAVMMGTPADLGDFATGFTVTEGLASGPEEIREIIVNEAADAIEVDVRLTPPAMRRFLARRRARAMPGRTSCGLCGVEELADLRSPTRRVRPGAPPGGPSIRRALASLGDRQVLHERTHAAHAAAWARPDGRLVAVREDVGRHNALDKLIGHGLREALDLEDGFCLVTSRCSFEMVQKAVAAGMPALVAVSAPTTLAIRAAEAAGLTLVARARGHGHTVYHAPATGPCVAAKEFAQ